jgi:hypothetical protein
MSGASYEDIGRSDPEIQEVMSKLNFISKIQYQEKIDLSSMTICYNGLSTKVYRTVVNLFGRGESSENTVKFISETIDAALNTIKKYRGPDAFSMKIRNLITTEIQNSKAGLNNLSKTYADDRYFSAEIESIIKILDTKIQSIELMKELQIENVKPSRSK